MKGALLAAGLSVAVVAALFGIFSWSPWDSERDRELAWLRAYVAWNTEIDGALHEGEDAPAVGCERRFVELVGSGTPSRLAAAKGMALAGCRALRRSIVDAKAEVALPDSVLEDWYGARDRVAGFLMDTRTGSARPRRAPLLAGKAAPLAGVRLSAFCWPGTEWQELSEEWQILNSDEFWLAGLADFDRERIHLAPSICEPLERFFGGNYTPYLNTESYELAEALVTLAHEAEHLRSPQAAEAEVECVAIQRVRDLIRAAGRPRSYADELAGLAWSVGYPNELLEYRTAKCKNGGPLDVRPGTDVWP